jgi:hypothetical protein
LVDAVGSAMAQTYPHIEAIVVDDGSTDNTMAVMDRLITQHGPRLRYLYQNNAGLSAARNTGYAAAGGEYVVWLDADDILDPLYAQRMLETLAASGGADGVYCGYRFVDEKNRDLPRVEQRTIAPGDLHDTLLLGNFWVPSSPMVKRACYQTLGGFDLNFRSCEDWDMWLRLSRTHRLVGIADVLVRYRVVQGSMSSNAGRMLDYRLLALRKHLGSQPAAPGNTLAHQAFARAYFRGAMEYYQFGEEQNALDCLRSAGSLYPPILLDHATYYELACSGQTRGAQGDISTLDVKARHAFLFDVIAQVKGSTNSGEGQPAALDTTSPAAMQAQALWAVGQLHYQHGSSSSARRVLLQAGELDRSLFYRREFAALLARTLLPAQQMAMLKRIAGH